MKINCKNCLPKEGIEIPDFTAQEKTAFLEWAEKSRLEAVKNLMREKNLSHLDAKFIVTHINVHYGHCNRCNFNKLQEEYSKCPKCGALNLNWKNELENEK